MTAPVQSCLWRGRVVQACRVFSCDRCGSLVRICSDCDRGNRYCGSECRHTSRVESCRRANRRYRRSPKGRRNQRRRQKRYRARETSRVVGTTAAVRRGVAYDTRLSQVRPPQQKTSASVSATVPLATATTVPESAVSSATPSTVTHQGSLPPAPDVFVASGRPAVPPGLGSLDCCMCGRSVSDHLRYTFFSGEDPG